MAQSSLLTASYKKRTLRFLGQVLTAFDTSSGHDHDGTNSKTISASVTYGTAGEMAANGTAAANAAGSTAKSARIDHVHKIGTHDHSDDTKGDQIGPSAFASDAFTADATGRAPFQDGIWSTAKLADGVLSADVTGRAKMAAGYISADATGRAFFAADFIAAADAASRAIFADDCLDSTFCAAKIADNAIPTSKVNWSYGVAGSVEDITPDDSASAGTTDAVARIDHQHACTCAAPADGSLAAANAEGSATSFSRSDHAHKAIILDTVELEFGTGSDAVMGWQTGDADNHTLVLGLCDTNQSLHITDKAAIATDWNVAANTHPTVYIHSNTTPATDHLKLYHDATDGFIDSVGGNLVLLAGGSERVSLESGTVVFNESGADVNFRVETDGAGYAIYADGGKNSVVLGANADASSADKVVTISRAARTVTTATSFADLWIEPAGACTTAGDASTMPVIATVNLSEPNITNGGGDTITVAATLYIKDAPTEGATNDAIHIAAGTARFLGGVAMVDQALDFTTGYIEFGTTPAASERVRVENNTSVWASRNQADGGDIVGWKVNAEDDYEAGADVNLGGNTLYGGTGANDDLTLAATTNGTKTTSYIISSQMHDASADGVATLVKAGAVGDGDFTATAINGLMGVDSSNGRFYFRYGAAWHYCTETAGFEVNATETDCPVCGKPMHVGDAVSGVLNEIKDDGALHGLWAHAKCCK